MLPCMDFPLTITFPDEVINIRFINFFLSLEIEIIDICVIFALPQILPWWPVPNKGGSNRVICTAAVEATTPGNAVQRIGTTTWTSASWVRGYLQNPLSLRRFGQSTSLSRPSLTNPAPVQDSKGRIGPEISRWIFYHRICRDNLSLMIDNCLNGS